MKQRQITGSEVWRALIGDEHGDRVRMILVALRDVPGETFVRAVAKIDHETTIGPLLNPTAYRDGARFDNADQYTAVLSKLAELRELIQ